MSDTVTAPAIKREQDANECDADFGTDDRSLAYRPSLIESMMSESMSDVDFSSAIKPEPFNSEQKQTEHTSRSSQRIHTPLNEYKRRQRHMRIKSMLRVGELQSDMFDKIVDTLANEIREDPMTGYGGLQHPFVFDDDSRRTMQSELQSYLVKLIQDTSHLCPANGAITQNMIEQVVRIRGDDDPMYTQWLLSGTIE